MKNFSTTMNLSCWFLRGLDPSLNEELSIHCEIVSLELCTNWSIIRSHEECFLLMGIGHFTRGLILVLMGNDIPWNELEYLQFVTDFSVSGFHQCPTHLNQ